jgi:hypothetical protein
MENKDSPFTKVIAVIITLAGFVGFALYMFELGLAAIVTWAAICAFIAFAACGLLKLFKKRQ